MYFNNTIDTLYNIVLDQIGSMTHDEKIPGSNPAVWKYTSVPNWFIKHMVVCKTVYRK